jgi:zinc protease
MSRAARVLARMAALLVAVCLTPTVTSAQARWGAEAPPRPLAARQVKFPPYDVRTLENGLQVVAVLHHEQPVVSMRMIVRAGASLDPSGKAGLAALAASLLDQGTETMSARQVNEQIDFIGGIMGAGAGPDLTFANVVVMKDSFETGLRMLSDMARRPAFAPEEIERQRQQVVSSLQVSLQDPEFVADAVFDRLVYGVHPYGVPQAGTPETLASITRDDLVEYHQRNFVPNNAILAIVGDVTADEAFDGVRKVFGDWQRRETTRAPFATPPEPARRVIVVNKPDAVQTEIRVGQLGVRRDNSDYMALNLAMRILGGEGANRLHQVLRTERGLTYGAKADMHTLLEGGDFAASTSTRSQATGEVLRLIVDPIWRLQRERVGERELSDAKAYLTGSFPLTIETPDAIATQVLNVLFYGLPVEQLQSFRERVNAVMPEDIERVARFYLRPDRLSIVLVGNAAAFSSQLRGLGFSSIETVQMDDLDLMSSTFRRDRRTAAVAQGGPLSIAPAPAAYQPASAQSTQRSGAGDADARRLLTEAIAAKGGLDRLRAVSRIKATTRSTNIGPNNQRDTVDTVTYLEYPNRVRVESRNGRAELVQVFDGQRAWVKDPAGVHDVPEEMVRDLESSFQRDTIAVLLAANDGRVNVRLLPDAKDDGGKVLRALEFSSPTLDPMVMYLDPATHLVAKQTYVAGGAGRPLIEEIFDDYRPVSGVSVAFKATLRVGGQPVLERVVTDIEINGAPFPPTLFARPAA